MAMPYSNLASYATIVELYFSEIRLHYLKFVYDIHWLQINFFLSICLRNFTLEIFFTSAGHDAWHNSSIRPRASISSPLGRWQ